MLIRSYLIDQGHVIVHDWLPKIPKKDGKYQIAGRMSEKEYKKVMAALDESDLIIIESSQPSFSTGHVLTLALEKKVPVLVLWSERSPWYKRRGMVEHIESDFIQIAIYDEENYKEIINSFIKRFSTNGQKHRFNLVIDDSEKQYLDWACYRSFKSKTRIIRDMIRNNMNSDPEYRKYLGKGNK